MPHRLKSRLKEGSVCKLLLLIAKPELNGQTGVLGTLNYRTGRYSLTLSDGSVIWVKRHNLCFIGCENCGEKCKTSCGKCRSVHYCSRDCQTADWPLHKKSCKVSKEKKPAESAAGSPSSRLPTVLVIENGQGAEGIENQVLISHKTFKKASSKAVTGELTVDGEVLFTVKIQVPIDNALVDVDASIQSPSMREAFRKQVSPRWKILVYNKQRTFLAYVCAASDSSSSGRLTNDRYDELHQFVITHGVGGVKVY